MSKDDGTTPLSIAQIGVNHRRIAQTRR
jgi:hypothetical protein